MSVLVYDDDVKWTDKHGDVRGPLCNIDYETLERARFRWTGDKKMTRHI